MPSQTMAGARRASRKLLYKARGGPPTRHELVGAPYLSAMKRRFQFRFLLDQGLEPQHRLLDIGCGTLRGGLPLIDYLRVGNYTGIESRPKVLEQARAELAEARLEHKRPWLICGEGSDSLPAASYHFAWAFSVLFHMPDEIVEGYLQCLSKALTEAGALYANVLLGEHQEDKWWQFPVLTRPWECYVGWASENDLSATRLGTLRSLGHRSGVPSDDGQIMVRFARQAADQHSPSPQDLIGFGGCATDQREPMVK